MDACLSFADCQHCYPVMLEVVTPISGVTTGMHVTGYDLHHADVDIGGVSIANSTVDSEQLGICMDCPPACLPVQAVGYIAPNAELLPFKRNWAEAGGYQIAHAYTDAQTLVRCPDCDLLAMPASNGDTVASCLNINGDIYGFRMGLDGWEAVLADFEPIKFPFGAFALQKGCGGCTQRGDVWWWSDNSIESYNASQLNTKNIKPIGWHQFEGHVATTLAASLFLKRFIEVRELVKAELNANAIPTIWQRITTAMVVSSRCSIEPYRINWAEAASKSRALMLAYGYTLQMLDVALHDYPQVDSYPLLDDKVQLVRVGGARSYKSVNRINADQGEAVLTLSDGRLIADLVDVWLVAGQAIVGHTEKYITLRQASGVVKLQALRLSGQIVELTVVITND